MTVATNPPLRKTLAAVVGVILDRVDFDYEFVPLARHLDPTLTDGELGVMWDMFTNGEIDYN